MTFLRRIFSIIGLALGVAMAVSGGSALAQSSGTTAPAGGPSDSATTGTPPGVTSPAPTTHATTHRTAQRPHRYVKRDAVQAPASGVSENPAGTNEPGMGHVPGVNSATTNKGGGGE